MSQQLPPLTTAPRTGDPDRAEDILDELLAVLQKRKCLLIHKPDCIVLAVWRPEMNDWRAIAQVEVIAPTVALYPGVVRWRPVEWGNEYGVKPS